MSLKKLIDRELVSCSPKTTIGDAAKIMKRKNVGSILVVSESGKPLGMITDRDIAIRCVADQADCVKMSVTEIMSKPVQTVRASEGIYNAIQVIKESGVRRVPVVDPAGKAVAIVSFGDLLQMLVQEFFDLTVKTTAEKSKLVRKAA